MICVPFEENLIIPLLQPAGRFLGTTARIIQGDCSIEVSDSVGEFSISMESNIIPSRYWGRGTSDVSISTYRLRNSKPERVVKTDVRRADLRNLVPESLGKMELVLENISLQSIHDNQTCMAKRLSLEFSLCER